MNTRVILTGFILPAALCVAGCRALDTDRLAQAGVYPSAAQATAETPCDPVAVVLPSNAEVTALFEPAAMEALIGWEPPIADRDAMAHGMRALLSSLPPRPSDDPDVQTTLAAMAAAYDPPKTVDELCLQYGRFFALYASAYPADDDPVATDFLTTTLLRHTPVQPHDDYYASTVQLRFGKVVGDALGLDPVFGALLNPTGGGLGPGNKAVVPDPDDPLGYHSVFHDAAGFLYTHFGVGPGYDYLGRSRLGWAASPLTGQADGIRYWTERLRPSN